MWQKAFHMLIHKKTNHYLKPFLCLLQTLHWDLLWHYSLQEKKLSECIFHTRKITVTQASQCRGVISWEMNFCNYTYKHTIRHASLIKLKLDFQHDIAMICSCMSHSIVVATYELEREMNYLWLSSNTNGWTIWEMSGVWQRACLLKQDSHL